MSLIVKLLLLIGFSLSAVGAEVVTGMIVVYDGSSVMSNAPVYEYSKLTIGSGAFKATLSDGRVISGLAGQIVSTLDYRSTDVPGLLIRMDEVSGRYEKSRPILRVRKEQFANKLSSSKSTPKNKSTPPDNSSVITGEPKQAPVQSLGDQASDAQLIDAFNKSRVESVRVSAVMDLAMRAKPEQFDFFSRAARDPERDVRKWGIRGLGGLKNQSAFNELVSIASGKLGDKGIVEEVIKQFIRIGAGEDEGLSVSAIQEMERFLSSPDTSPATKDLIRTELVRCAIEGGRWVRSKLAANNSKEVAEILKIVAAADAVAKKAEEAAAIAARDAELAFTAEDRQILSDYAKRRLRVVSPKLEDQESNLKRGYNYDFEEFRPIKDIVSRLKRDQSDLKSQDPSRIAKAAIHQIEQIADLIQRIPRYGKLRFSHETTSENYVISPHYWNSIYSDGERAIDAIGGIFDSAAASIENAKINSAKETAEMLQSLSGPTKRHLGIMPTDSTSQKK